MIKSFKTLLVGAAFALLAPATAMAAPVTWTIPSTSIAGGRTVSGSFVYDSTLPQPVVNVNITEDGGPTPTTYGFVGGQNVSHRYGQVVASTSAGGRGVYFNVSGISPTGAGSYVSDIGVGPCDTVSSGLCTHVDVENSATGGFATSVMITPPVAAVPTLSEWALILLSLMLAGGAAVMVQRQHQRQTA